MRSEIRELHQRLSTTTVYVTHDQIEAMTMADKIVVMHDGNIEQIGSPLDLYDFPNNKFVASFIGSPSMNLIDGVVRIGDSSEIEVCGARFPISDIKGIKEGQKVTFGVRPEHLVISDVGMKAKVSLVEPTGSETHIISRIGDTELVTVSKERYAFTPGEDVHLKPIAEFVHIFDVETGNRLS